MDLWVFLRSDQKLLHHKLQISYHPKKKDQRTHKAQHTLSVTVFDLCARSDRLVLQSQILELFFVSVLNGHDTKAALIFLLFHAFFCTPLFLPAFVSFQIISPFHHFYSPTQVSLSFSYSPHSSIFPRSTFHNG